MVMHTSRLAEAGLFITPAGKVEGGGGEGGRLSADSATLINVIWSWQWTPNSSRPWSSCRSPLPVPNSPNYRNIAQQIKCGVICRLVRHFIIHSWQRVRGLLLDCLTWHPCAVPFIIVCIYRNERAGYFVKPVIKSSHGEASFFFLLPHTEDAFSSLAVAGKWQWGRGSRRERQEEEHKGERFLLCDGVSADGARLETTNERSWRDLCRAWALKLMCEVQSSGVRKQRFWTSVSSSGEETVAGRRLMEETQRRCWPLSNEV